VASPGLVERRTGAGGESSLTTLPQASFATVATRRRGEQSLTLHRPAGPPHVDYDPFDPIRQGIERAAPPSVCVRSSRTALPSRGRPHSEKTGEMAKTCGAFPQLGNAPHKFTSPLRSGHRLQEQSPSPAGHTHEGRACWLRRIEPRHAHSEHRRRRQAGLSPVCGLPKERKRGWACVVTAKPYMRCARISQ
jgi:hypothetical protein